MPTSAAPTLDWVYVPSHVAEGPAQVRHKDGWLVCEVPADGYAKLMAAAPEMAAVLRACLDAFSGVRFNADEYPGLAAAVRSTRAVLAKAGAA